MRDVRIRGVVDGGLEVGRNAVEPYRQGRASMKRGGKREPVGLHGIEESGTNLHGGAFGRELVVARFDERLECEVRGGVGSLIGGRWADGREIWRHRNGRHSGEKVSTGGGAFQRDSLSGNELPHKPGV